jgi:hypothetical protein
MDCRFSRRKSDDPKFCCRGAALHGEQPTIFDQRLQMAIGLWFLPKGIHFRLAAFLDDENKARRFYFEQFHGVARLTNSARELRQRRSNYRCCIPALAGFVSLQSIASDGVPNFREDRCGAIIFEQTDSAP